MYCKRCGAPTGSDAHVCPSCARQQRPVRRKPKGFLYTVKGYMHMIILLMSVVALVFGLLNVFSVFNVVGIVSNDEVRETQYVTTEEMDEALKLMETSFAAGYIGNVIFGLFTLVAAVIGILFVLKRMMGMPFYNMFVGSTIGRFGGPGFVMGVLVIIGGLVQNMMYMFCRAEMTLIYTITIKAGVNWTTWLMMGLFAGLLVLERLLPRKRR